MVLIIQIDAQSIRFSNNANNKNYLTLHHHAVSCSGLKAEWTSTIETTTQFPVLSENVVEVTCSDSGALNKGSSEVTCTSGNAFNYVKEPSCSRPGIKHKYHTHLLQVNAMRELKLVYVTTRSTRFEYTCHISHIFHLNTTPSELLQIAVDS